MRNSFRLRQRQQQQQQQQQQKDDDGYVARRSNHVSGEKYSRADGDIWNETLAVCEMDGKLTIRSYYTSINTGQRVWDEPPSGASHIECATDQMRKMANVQLQEMQISSGDIPDSEQEPQPKKKGVLGGLFRRNKDISPKPPQDPKITKDGRKVHPRIQYKPDSVIARASRTVDHLDPGLQEALAASLSPSGSDHLYEQQKQEDELAIALSMSIADAHQNHAPTTISPAATPSTMPSSSSSPPPVSHITPPVSVAAGPSVTSTPPLTPPHTHAKSPPLAQQATVLSAAQRMEGKDNEAEKKHEEKEKDGSDRKTEEVERKMKEAEDAAQKLRDEQKKRQEGNTHDKVVDAKKEEEKRRKKHRKARFQSEEEALATALRLSIEDVQKRQKEEEETLTILGETTNMEDTADKKPEESKEQTRKHQYRQMTEEEAIALAIASSLADTGKSRNEKEPEHIMKDPEKKHKSRKHRHKSEEAKLTVMATALSLSEAASPAARAEGVAKIEKEDLSKLSEEEQLRLVLEASMEEAKSAGVPVAAAATTTASAADESTEHDRKMPAKEDNDTKMPAKEGDDDRKMPAKVQTTGEADDEVTVTVNNRGNNSPRPEGPLSASQLVVDRKFGMTNTEESEAENKHREHPRGRKQGHHHQNKSRTTASSMDLARRSRKGTKALEEKWMKKAIEESMKDTPMFPVKSPARSREHSPTRSRSSSPIPPQRKISGTPNNPNSSMRPTARSRGKSPLRGSGRHRHSHNRDKAKEMAAKEEEMMRKAIEASLKEDQPKNAQKSGERATEVKNVLDELEEKEEEKEKLEPTEPEEAGEDEKKEKAKEPSDQEKAILEALEASRKEAERLQAMLAKIQNEKS